MWSDLGYHVSFGILEVPNLIKSQTYLKYGWVWGCMSQTWTYPKATMLIWNMVRFSKYGIQTWLCPKSALGYPRLDLGYDHIWNIDLSQIWSSIWDVRNQNSSLGYPKADLGHRFSLGYNIPVVVWVDADWFSPLQLLWPVLSLLMGLSGLWVR